MGAPLKTLRRSSGESASDSHFRRSKMDKTAMEPNKLLDWSIAGRPMTGQTVSGDLHVVELWEDGALLAAIDGLGHGEEAGVVARKAANILKQHAGEPIITLLQRCHEALARTRGAVMTLASIDARDNSVSWLGVGNVEAWLCRAESDITHPREHILLRSGVVGLQLPALHASLMPLAHGDLLVFATDGIRPGFEAQINLTESPRQMAEGILSRNCKGSDDALVLVARYALPRKSSPDKHSVRVLT
jgi:hypothetical protein